MKDQPSEKEQKISRRGMLPLLGSGLLIPFLGFGKTAEDATDSATAEDEEYKFLLKPDGTTVKVKASAIKNSKVIKKNVSNTSFLSWLNKKL